MYENLDDAELLRASLDAMGNDRNAEAVSLLKVLIERDPGNFHGHYLLAAEHMQLGMVDRAEEGFRRAVALAPDFPMARFQLGQLFLVKGDREAAGQTLAPLAEGQPETALAFYVRGMLAAADGDNATAVEALRSGLTCEQELPALTLDMQHLLANLATPGGGGMLPTQEGAAAGAAPLYLSAYDRARS